MTAPGIEAGLQVRSDRAGADRVRWPARLPETPTGQEELLGGMNQVEFLSVLHIVVNLRRES